MIDRTAPLPQLSGRVFLTDAGLETDLIFNHGVEIRSAQTPTPSSLADTKRLVYEGFGVRYPEALQTIDEVQYAALDRVDAKEGAAALIEKRPPSFPRLGS